MATISLPGSRFSRFIRPRARPPVPMTPMRIRLLAPPWNAVAAARVPATMAPDVAARNERRFTSMAAVLASLRFVVGGTCSGGDAVGARPARMRGDDFRLDRRRRLVDGHALRLERDGAIADAGHDPAVR